MLSVFYSKIFVFLGIFALLLPLMLVGFSPSYSFAHEDNNKYENSQTFVATGVIDTQGAVREDFWFPVMIWPVSNPTISSGFGYRKAPCSSCSSNHLGIDFVPGYASEIFVVMDGIVVGVGSRGEYGTCVIVEHPNGWQTLYAHMIPRSQTVAIGDKIIQGKVIGLVGNSGVSTGAHLHFEIIIDGVQQNPLPILNELTKR
jgi:murein DD-endopeptidase MepM/ murein hydrolase activator NlpD